MRLFTGLLLALFLAACNNSTKENAPATAEQVTAKYDPSTDSTVYTDEMKRYWLVMLRKGTNRTQDSASSARIQAAHIANIERLAKQGKIIMAGPMGVDNDLRGIFIMDCKDSTEVEQLVKTDSAIITGRLRMEYFPWWSAKGKFIFK